LKKLLASLLASAFLMTGVAMAAPAVKHTAKPAATMSKSSKTMKSSKTTKSAKTMTKSKATKPKAKSTSKPH
jgi:hypothetical protein